MVNKRVCNVTINNGDKKSLDDKQKQRSGFKNFQMLFIMFFVLLRFALPETFVFATANCLPWVPEKGTVGASGDLAPLSHLALGMMGEGKMWSPKSGWADAKYVCYIKENIYANTKTSFSFHNICNKHNNAEIV